MAHTWRSCSRRSCAGLLSLVGVAFALLLTTSRADAAGFLDTGALQTSRLDHTATLLPSGKVLVVGGYHTGYLASAEIYDPDAGTWSPGAPLAVSRGFIATAPLPSGSVLVAGGNTNAGPTAACERYDAPSGTWLPAAPLPEPRTAHTATALLSGKVLVVGGLDDHNVILAAAQLYDPATDSWSPAGSLGMPRYYHAAVLLATGQVLVVGGLGSGRLAGAELYDPGTNAWTPAGALPNGVMDNALTLLESGEVLATGGDAFSGRVTDATIYDPATNSWRATAPLARARDYHTATLLRSGKVLVIGGYDFPTVIGTSELYDPVAETWTPAGTLNTPRLIHTATPLPSGRILIAGGRNVSGPLASAELYAPETTTTITSIDPPTTSVGDVYFVSVTVEGVSGTPTGTVNISDGNGGESGPMPLSDGFAFCPMVSGVAGTLTLTATYTPDDGTFDPSSGMAEHQVDALAVDVEITTVTPEPSIVGEPVSVAFTVTSDGPMPSGSVTVEANTGESCTATVADGACSLVFAVDGPRTLTASYAGDAAHFGGTSPGDSHDVVEADTSLAITGHSPDPSLPFETVTVSVEFAVIPPGGGTPHGGIYVGDGVDTCTIPEGGTSCDIVLSTRGPRTLTANYGGDGDFNPSTATASHRVNQLPIVANAQYATLEGAPLQVGAAQGVLVGSTDPDGDPLQVANAGTFAASGVGGTVELHEDGSFAYTPPAQGAGKDTFGFNVSDGFETVWGTAVVTVGPAADLSVSIDDGEAFAPGGAIVEYTIIVDNAGPGAALGARVRDIAPANLLEVTWSCVASDGATCASSGSGDIDDVVDIPVGAVLTYVMTATVATDPEIPVVNTVAVSVPGGTTDTNPGNDSATDVDTTGIFEDGFDTPETQREERAARATRTQ